MGLGSNPRRKHKGFGYYGQGKGVYVPDELRLSEAYQVLTPTQKNLLVDMLRAYLQASNFDKENISKVATGQRWKSSGVFLQELSVKNQVMMQSIYLEQ